MYEGALWESCVPSITRTPVITNELSWFVISMLNPAGFVDTTYIPIKHNTISIPTSKISKIIIIKQDKK